MRSKLTEERAEEAARLVAEDLTAIESPHVADAEAWLRERGVEP